MSQKALTPVNVPRLAADPTTPTLRAGDLYANSGTGALRVYSGSAWANTKVTAGDVTTGAFSGGTYTFNDATDGQVHFTGGAADTTAFWYGDIDGTQKYRADRNGQFHAVSLNLHGGGDALSGASTFSVDTSGALTTNTIHTTGSGNQFQFDGRDNPAQAWVWYAQTNTARLYSGTANADRLLIDGSGNVTVGGGVAPGGNSYLQMGSNIASYGYVRLVEGNATQTGYVAGFAGNNSREWYIGWATGNAGSDSGTLNYVAGTHSFSGGVTFGSAPNSPGGYSDNGGIVYSINHPPDWSVITSKPSTFASADRNVVYSVGNVSMAPGSGTFLANSNGTAANAWTSAWQAPITPGGGGSTFWTNYVGGTVVSIIAGTTRVNSGTKTFVIDHPTPEKRDKKYLVHAAVEGPESAVFYRGRARLDKGIASVKLPDYFSDLCDEETATVQVTPLSVWVHDHYGVFNDEHDCAVNWTTPIPEYDKNGCNQHVEVPNLVTSPIVDGEFIVGRAGGFTGEWTETAEFYWLVIAERKDVEHLEVELDKETTRVAGDGPYRYIVRSAK